MLREFKVNGVEGVFLVNDKNEAEKVLLKEVEELEDMKLKLSEASKRFLEVQFDEDMCRKIVVDIIDSNKMNESDAIKFRELSHMLYRV